MLVPFGKKWINYADQVAVLRGRGLVIADQPAAEWFLGHVNYYRFSGYCLAFEVGGVRHSITPGTTFEQVKGAYDFDYDLRDLLSGALEIIEVDLRTAIAHHFGQQYGPFGHINPNNFRRIGTPRQGSFDHARWLNRLRGETDRSKEIFAKHLKHKYTECQNNDFPVWVATEVMSFGAVSNMLNGMHFADQGVVASRYAVPPVNFASWAHHLSHVRNTCAHHCRVWDRTWSVSPTLPAAAPWWRPPHLAGNDRVAVTLLILNQLLKVILRAPDPGPAVWRGRAASLLNRLPSAPAAADKLGINTDWFVGPLWQ